MAVTGGLLFLIHLYLGDFVSVIDFTAASILFPWTGFYSYNFSKILIKV